MGRGSRGREGSEAAVPAAVARAAGMAMSDEVLKKQARGREALLSLQTAQGRGIWSKWRDLQRKDDLPV